MLWSVRGAARAAAKLAAFVATRANDARHLARSGVGIGGCYLNAFASSGATTITRTGLCGKGACSRSVAGRSARRRFEATAAKK